LPATNDMVESLDLCQMLGCSFNYRCG